MEMRTDAVVVGAGLAGLAANHELVRRNWPDRLGPPPERMLSGVPDHVDGLMLGVAEEAGARLINRDRMWHYTEGIENWAPIWSRHGIRILPGPSSLWLDALGRRLPPPLFPGFDRLGTLEHIVGTGFDHSWFILTQRIIEKEFALSGSEQNPDLTGRRSRPGTGSWREPSWGGASSPAGLPDGERWSNSKTTARRATAGPSGSPGSPEGWEPEASTPRGSPGPPPSPFRSKRRSPGRARRCVPPPPV